MNSKVACVIFALCAFQAIDAWTTQDVTLKIIATQQYLSGEVSKHKREIPQAIASTRSTLRSRAEDIKTEIRAGPISCNQQWITQIDSILQYQINFLYAFQACEMTSEIGNLDRIKYSLQELQKSANQLIGLCAIIGNCQSNINSLYKGVELIEADIAAKSAAIAASADRCLGSKKSSVDRLLLDAYNYWKKCSHS